MIAYCWPARLGNCNSSSSIDTSRHRKLRIESFPNTTQRNCCIYGPTKRRAGGRSDGDRRQCADGRRALCRRASPATTTIVVVVAVDRAIIVCIGIASEVTRQTCALIISFSSSLTFTSRSSQTFPSFPPSALCASDHFAVRATLRFAGRPCTSMSTEERSVDFCCIYYRENIASCS